MINNLKHQFPVDLMNSYETLRSLRESKTEWRYKFMNEIEYSKIQEHEFEANIYWSEMLFRIHIIVLVSSFKTLRWIEAMDNNSSNYYGFCSSLRGLIESVADTFYTLRNIPLTIARDFVVIKKQINENSGVLITHGKLESELLHYIQATKLDKSQKDICPKSFNSKQIREYLDSVDDPQIISLYSFLCGISHPAFESNQIFLFSEKGDTIVCNDSFALESGLIDAVIEKNSKTISNLFRIYMNNLVSVILLLNEFKIDKICFDISIENEFKKNEIWKEISEYMAESEIKYKNALQLGKYE